MKDIRTTSRVRALATLAGGVASTRARGRPGSGMHWLGSTLAALLMLASARAQGPVNPRVTHGNATFEKVGNNWVIRTSQKTIVSYSSFDIAHQQWVRFIQPGADSRVLNRIDGAAPTRIDGTLLANGRVYFVNPAGVIFGNGAVINCGSFAAAAGQLSDQDFLAGRDHFTNLTGNVENRGRIEVAQGGTATLVGQHVANYGSIVAPQGTVVLAAGSDVLVGESGGRIYARIEGDGTARPEGVRNDGLIEATRGRTLMAAGDIYGMAVINTGRVIAKDVKVDGGKKGEVRISGQIDASGKQVGETGGRVEVTGENIALVGATVDVSGDSGGGTALIGGGREGHGLENTANALFASGDSRINADAIRTGNGGEIVLYSHNSTMSGASLTARGGFQSGNGGYVETSGGWLAIFGAPDTSARALLGKGGEWLIDPLDLDVVNTPTVNMSGPPVFTPVGGPGQLLVTDLLTALSLNSIVTLKTTGTVGAGTGLIRFQTALDLGAMTGTHTLNVISAGGIEINAAIHASSTGDAFNLNLSAVNNVTIAAGVEVLLNSGTFTSSGVNFNGGKLISAGGGGIWINHTGSVTLGSITTLSPTPGGTTLFARGTSFTSTGTLKTNGGKIDIIASAGDVSLGGAGPTVIDTTGSGGVRGDVLIRAKGALSASVPITGNNILLTSGANMTISGNADAAAVLDFRAGQDGAGTLAFTGVGGLSLTGQTINLVAGDSVTPLSTVRFDRAVSLTSALKTTNISAGPGLIQITGAGSITQTNNGRITMTADEVDFSGALNSVAGGTLRLTTATSGRQIVLGAATPGTMNLTTAELAQIGAGFSLLELVKSGQTGNITVDGNTSMSRGVNFLLGSGALRLNADLTLTGSFLNNGRTLIGPGSIKLTAGSATFAGLVDAAGPGANFTVVGTDAVSLITFLNSIGAGSALTSLTIDGTFASTTTARVRNVVRSGSTLFKTKAEIQSNTTFSGGAVAFNHALDSGLGGPYSATFLGGPVSFLGGVGQSSALSSILTVGNAIVSGNVTTTGSQSYGGNLNVNAASTFLAGGPWNVLGATVLDGNTVVTASEAYFAGTVNSASAVARDLTVTGTSGNVTFASSIGAPPGFALGSLTVDTPGNTYITGTVRAANARFKSATELLSDVSLQGGSFTFDKTLNSRVGGPYALTTLGVSTLTLSGEVGGLSGQQLLSLDATGAALTKLGANVTADNFIRFGATELNANSVVTSLLNKPVDFGVVTSEPTPWSLEVVTNDVATFHGGVGTGAKRLASLRHTGNGLTILKGNTFTTGLQTFGGDVSFEGAGPQSINAGTTLFVAGSSTLKTDVSVFAPGGATFTGAVFSPGIAHSLAVDSLGDVLFGGAVGTAGERLSSLTRTGAAGTTILRGDTFTSGLQSFAGDVSFESAVPQTVNAGTTLFVGGISILKTDLDVFSPGGATFTGAVTSPGAQRSLAVDSAATVLFGGPVGTGAERLSSLTRTGAAGTTILKGDSFTSGAQSFAGNVSFEGPGAQLADAGTNLFIGGTTALKTDLTVLAPSGATFTGVVFSSGGAHDLHVTSAGLVNFMSAIGLGGSLGTLLVDGTGTTRVTTLVDAANATFEQGVDLAANTIFQGGPVTFKQRLDSLIAGASGAEFKGLAGVGALDMRGAVGGQRALAFLISHVDTTVRSNVTTVNQQQFDKTLDVLGPSIFNAGGAFAVTGKTTLTGRATINAAGVNFGEMIDSAPGVPTGELFVMSTNSAPINFANSIGATNRLLLLDVNGANPTLTTTTINGTLDVGATDLRTRTLLGSDVHLHNGDYTFHQLLDSGPGGPFGLDTAAVANLVFLADVGSTSPLAFLDAGNAGTTILGGNVTANGFIKFGTTELDADSIVKSNLGGPIDFGAITSPAPQNLTVDTTGVVTFGGTVGSLTNPLASLTVLNASLTRLNGDVSTNAGITLGATELDGSPIIVTSLLGGAIGFGPITSPTPQSLTINTTGILTFGGPVGTAANPLASLTSTGAGLTKLNGDVFANGAIAFGSTELDANVKVKSFASTIGFGTLTSPVAHSLIVETPVGTTFGGGVGSLANPLLSLDATGSALTKLNGDVFANTFIRFAAVELDNSSLIKSLLGGPIDFGTITSPAPQSLTVDTTGIVTFGGTVGSLANPLASLTILNASLTRLNGDVTTNAGISFGATELDGGPIIITSLLGGAIGFGAITSPTPQSLTVNTAGVVTFGGPVGTAANPLASLTSTGAGLTKLNGDVFANGAIAFGATELDANVKVKSFASTIGFGTLTSPVAHSLIVETPVSATFGGTVGSLANPLLSLDATGALLTRLNGDVFANNFIKFADTELDADATITSVLDQAIEFGAITSSPSPWALGVQTGGTATFHGPIGTSANRLASVTRTGLGGITILQGDTFTTGGQTYAGNVIFDKAFNPLSPQSINAGGPLFIGGTSTLNTNVDVLTNGATFALAVDSGIGGARSLHVTSAGAVLFGGPIGSTLALENITVDGGGVTTLNTKVTTTAGGLAKFDNATLLGSDLDLAGGTFRFGSTLDSGPGGPFALRSVGSGTVEFVGDAGGFSLLRSVDTQLAADTRLHGALNARDDIKLSELRLLGAGPKSVASTTSTIDFFGKVAADSASAFTVAAPGKVEFHQEVGSGILGLGALGTLVRTGPGLTVLDGNATTSGGQSYSADLDLNGSLTLTYGLGLTVFGTTRMFGPTTLNGAGVTTFYGSVDSAGGPKSLLMNNAGLGIFVNGLGSGGALSALTVNGVGTTQFTGDVRLIPGGVMTVNQAAEVRGPTDIRAGTINFNSTLDAAAFAINPTLFLMADAANFAGNVGILRPLQSLDASGVTLSRVYGAVTTSGGQVWNTLLLSGVPGIRTFNASSAVYAGAIDAASNSIAMSVVAPGLVVFGGPVGMGGAGGAALSSLFSGSSATVLAGDVRTIGATTFGGALVTFGVRTVNTSTLTVLGATVLGNDFTVNGVNARFAGAVDSLAGMNSSLLANVSGETRFENGVGQNAPLRNVRSNAFTNLLRGSLTTIASGQSWFTGELRIDSAPTGLTTIDSGMIFVGRDIFTDAAAAGPANLTLLGRAVPTITTAPIRIGGNIGASSLGGAPSQAFGNLVLGGTIGLPQVSSIVMARTFDSLGRIVAAGVSPSDSYVILANSIAMSPGQKLTVLGSLTMTGTQSVLIGDITTLGDMNVNSANITIQSRSPFSVLDNTGNPIVDIGTDLVAGGAIHFSRAPIVPPGAGTFSYSAIAGPDPTLQNFSFRQYPYAITVNNFRDMRPGSTLGPNFLLSLDFASLGPTSTNVADTKVVQPPRLGEVQRVRQAVAVDPADVELLRELGLTVKAASPQEIVQSFIGYSYYQNVPKIPDPNIENGDYVVTADRLWMKAVSDLVKSYRSEMQRMVPDGAGKLAPQSRSAEIQQLFTDSWDRFAAGKPASNAPEAELAEYQSYVLTHPEELATREELARVDHVLRKLQNLGLTRMEASIPEERILEMIRPSALTTDDMRQVLGAVRAADVPLGTPDPTGRPAPQTPPPVAERATPLFEVSKR